MKITVTSFTNPIDPTLVIARVDKSFSSGGGGGGGTAVQFLPTGEMNADANQVNPYNTGAGEHILGSFTLNLIGGRKMLLMGFLSGFGAVGALNSTLFFRVGGAVVNPTFPLTAQSGGFTVSAVKNGTPAGPTLIELVLNNVVGFAGSGFNSTLSALEFQV